ncbi:unnamed protein product [Pleuronectes platessa]|uniref:Uncharacterized protein n=1 Tax=Pleuronectes platessa TaxID=8262 RepID=A0A9N7Z622_PLEPL|nr:unnamed protein product [Pleuronectes platessa]
MSKAAAPRLAEQAGSRVAQQAWQRGYTRLSPGQREVEEAGRGMSSNTGEKDEDVPQGGVTERKDGKETQIKEDLSSQDLFRAVPSSSVDPVAVLFLPVLTSVWRGDEALELSHSKVEQRGPGVAEEQRGSPTHRLCGNTSEEDLKFGEAEIHAGRRIEQPQMLPGIPTSPQA